MMTLSEMKGCTLIYGIFKKAFPAGNCNLKKWAENGIMFLDFLFSPFYIMCMISLVSGEKFSDKGLIIKHQ